MFADDIHGSVFGKVRVPSDGIELEPVSVGPRIARLNKESAEICLA